jgi:hypothetical protein
MANDTVPNAVRGTHPQFTKGITPPPGFPFIVLPALPVEPETPPPQIERRMLAENVVAMFAEDRAPVVNPKRRGRFPRRVFALRLWERIHVGDYCLIWACGTSPRVNHGRMVKVTGYSSQDGKWKVQAIGGPLTTFDPDHPEDVASHSYRTTSSVATDRLRRCAKPAQARA